MIRKDLTLVGPTRDNPESNPLAVLHLKNWLHMSVEGGEGQLESAINIKRMCNTLVAVKNPPYGMKRLQRNI